jgi:hypothetical protein
MALITCGLQNLEASVVEETSNYSIISMISSLILILAWRSTAVRLSNSFKYKERQSPQTSATLRHG